MEAASAVKGRHHSVWEWVVVGIFGLFFVLPMLAMGRFALQRVPVALLGRHTLFSRWTLKGVTSTLTDEKFRPALLLSLRLGILTVLLVLFLMVPTVLWIRLAAPRWRPLVEAASLLPYVVPPIALVVGVAGAYRDSVPWIVSSNEGLVPLYAVLCLPFAFRSLDAGVAAIDIRTLVDASRNLGAGTYRTLMSVLVPNLWVSIISTAFLCFAVVMGEFAIASLLLKQTLPAYMVEAQGQEPQGAMAVSLMLLVLTTTLFALIGRLDGRHGRSARKEPHT